MSGNSRYSLEQREAIVREAREVGNIRAVADKHGLNVRLVYGWVKAFRNKEFNQHRKSIRQLEKELADKELENQILKELLKKTTQAWIKG